MLEFNNNKNKNIFTANGEMIKFEGFLKVYLEGTDNEDEEQEGMLPNLTSWRNFSRINILLQLNAIQKHLIDLQKLLW